MRSFLLKPFLFLGNKLGQWTVFNVNPASVALHQRDLQYGMTPEQKLDVIIPKGIKEARPMVIFLHGGGWLSGTKDSYTRVCKQLAQSGAVVINANYRLGPRHQYPAQLQDAVSVLEWTIQHAADFGGDPAHIFLAGDSAGAHLASWVTAALNQPALLTEIGARMPLEAFTLRGTVLFFGVYDFETVLSTGFWNIRTMTHEGFLGEEKALYTERARIASSIRHLEKGCAPLFICCGEVDPLFSESVALAEKAKEKGVPHETLFFSKEEHPEARHAFINIPVYPCADLALNAANQFIRDHCVLA